MGVSGWGYPDGYQDGASPAANHRPGHTRGLADYAHVPGANKRSCRTWAQLGQMHRIPVHSHSFFISFTTMDAWSHTRYEHPVRIEARRLNDGVWEQTDGFQHIASSACFHEFGHRWTAYHQGTACIQTRLYICRFFESWASMCVRTHAAIVGPPPAGTGSLAVDGPAGNIHPSQASTTPMCSSSQQEIVWWPPVLRHTRLAWDGLVTHNPSVVFSLIFDSCLQEVVITMLAGSWRKAPLHRLCVGTINNAGLHTFLGVHWTTSPIHPGSRKDGSTAPTDMFGAYTTTMRALQYLCKREQELINTYDPTTCMEAGGGGYTWSFQEDTGDAGNEQRRILLETIDRPAVKARDFLRTILNYWWLIRFHNRCGEPSQEFGEPVVVTRFILHDYLFKYLCTWALSRGHTSPPRNSAQDMPDDKTVLPQGVWDDEKINIQESLHPSRRWGTDTPAQYEHRLRRQWTLFTQGEDTHRPSGEDVEWWTDSATWNLVIGQCTTNGAGGRDYSREDGWEDSGPQPPTHRWRDLTQGLLHRIAQTTSSDSRPIFVASDQDLSTPSRCSPLTTLILSRLTLRNLAELYLLCGVRWARQSVVVEAIECFTRSTYLCAILLYDRLTLLGGVGEFTRSETMSAELHGSAVLCRDDTRLLVSTVMSWQYLQCWKALGRQANLDPSVQSHDLRHLKGPITNLQPLKFPVDISALAAVHPLPLERWAWP